MKRKRKSSGLKLDKQTNIRFDEKTRAQLEEEAAAIGLELGVYVRMLVFTHPDRPQKKESK